MKIITILTFLPFFVFGQTNSIPRDGNGLYEYQAVVSVDSTSAEKLYAHAKQFLLDAFAKGKCIIDLEDRDTWAVAAMGDFYVDLKGKFRYEVGARLTFRMIIQCKENRYRYQISNLKAHFIGKDVNRSVPLEDSKTLTNYFLTKRKLDDFHLISNTDLVTLLKDLKKEMSSGDSLASGF